MESPIGSPEKPALANGRAAGSVWKPGGPVDAEWGELIRASETEHGLEHAERVRQDSCRP